MSRANVGPAPCARAVPVATSTMPTPRTTFLMSRMTGSFNMPLSTLDSGLSTPDYLTVMFTNPFVQQHWNPTAMMPRDGRPDVSHASTRSVYSPGSRNVAVVVALPASSSVGSTSLKVTCPGPRYLLQMTPSAGSLRGDSPPCPRFRTMSSFTRTVSATGSATPTFMVLVVPPGPWPG